MDEEGREGGLRVKKGGGMEGVREGGTERRRDEER